MSNLQKRLKLLPTSHQRGIVELVESFDFAKVQRVMEFLGWRYFDGVPTADRLKEVAYMVLMNAAADSLQNMPGSYCLSETGGFRGVCVEESGSVSFTLEFILEDKQTEKKCYVS